jgi:micrococcal nuclease
VAWWRFPGLWGMSRLPAAAVAVMIIALEGGAVACPTGPVETVQVAEVISATELRLADGRRIRLAQLLIEPAAAGESAARIAAAAQRSVAEAVAQAGGRLAIRTLAARPDRHGRIPANVETPGRGGGWLQGRLVESGLAQVSALLDDPTCIGDLLRREAAARSERRGLWSTEIGTIWQAGDPGALAARTGHFAIVEGRIVSVGERRRRTYLNFGVNWVEDFTVLIEADDLPRLQAAGLVVGDLEGRWVRVRGWIRDDRGPAIRITHPGQLDIVGTR